MTEQELFARICKGDEQALDFIYRKYYRMMVRLVTSNNGTENEAKDVYQEALVVFWQKANSGNLVLTSKMSTYIYSICLNLWRKELERKKRFSNEEKDATEYQEQEKEEKVKIIHECIEISRSLEGKNDILILDDVNNDVECYANVDPVRFKQVIINLLSNAIKFNREKGRVTVKCDFINKQFIKISICDEGEGLTKNQELEVFDAFQRLDANEKSIDGIGIGLNIAKSLVELMGGNIGVESRVGIGSCFWIDLPIIEVVDKSVNSGFETDKNIENITNHEHYKILYIEDDEFNLELVREILSVMRPEIKLYEAITAELGLDIIK